MRITFKNSYFLIEGPGVAMNLITEWLAARDEALDRAFSMLHELGVTHHTRDDSTGVVTGVAFPRGEVPAGWTKPDKYGVSRPKKGTDEYKRFNAQVGHPKASPLIKSAFNIPTSMKCEGPNGERFIEMGHWFEPCGFATMGDTPPFLLVIPNVAYYVAKAEAEGYTVPAEVKAFKPEFEGCRAITEDDWDLMVLRAEKSKEQAS